LANFIYLGEIHLPQTLQLGGEKNTKSQYEPQFLYELIIREREENERWSPSRDAKKKKANGLIPFCRCRIKNRAYNFEG